MTAAPGSSSPAPSNQVFQYTNNPPPPIPQTGTANPPYQPTWQRDPPPSIGRDAPPPHLFHVINAMEPYRGGSFEELRMLDYQQGRKEPTAQPAPAATGFGQPAASGFGTSSGGFGQPAATPSTFGQAKPGGLFGSTGATSTFGAPAATTSTFGQAQSTGGLFGQQQQQPTTSTFGQPAAGATTGGLFGQPAAQPAATGGLFGSNPNPFGQTSAQQPQSTGFGGFGAAAAKPAGFGATPGTTNAFGQTGTTTGFGQTPAAPAPTSFGGFGQTQQQPQQQQQATGGLFGNTTNPFGQTSAASPGTSLFGQTNTQQQPAATGGLFGSTAAKPAGGLFGSSPAASTATGGFGGFGAAAAPAQPATTGLFGSAPAAQPAATGGLFGQQPAAAPAAGGLFGSNTGGSSLFGAKPTAPATGGLFGSAPAAQPAATGTSSFGGFGQTGTGGGLFGNTNTAAAAPATTSLFGAKPAAPATGGLFGSTAAAPAATGGLFGSLGQTQQPASTGLFGSTTQTQTQAPTGGLFGSTLGQSTAQPAQNLTASVDQNPYGRSELFAYQGQKLELGSVNKKPALPPLTASSYRVTPTKGRVTQLRGFAAPLSASQSNSRSGSPVAASSNNNRSVIGSPVPSERYKGLTETSLSPNAFIPRANVKKISVATPKLANGSEDPLESVLGKSALKSSTNSLPPTPEPVRSPAFNASGSTRSNIDDTPTRRPQSVQIETSIRPVATERPLKRGDYWCKPKLEKLRSMSHEELSKIENFTAGRKGYGEVVFLEPVDLTGLASLHDLLGKVIVVEDLELAVYPEDGPKKPARGKGLNHPAQISLENCFARDKATRQPVTDPRDPRYQRQVKRVKAVPDTEFVSFTEDGVWTFIVDHFSRYGIAGSDDEDDADEGVASPSPPKSGTLDRSLSPSITEEEETDEDDDFLPPTRSIYDNMMTADYDSGLDGDVTDESMEEDLETEREDNGDMDMQPDWDRPIKSKLGAQGMRNMRAMQASFFGSAEPKAPKQSALDVKRAAAVEAARALERKRVESGFGDAEEGFSTLDNRAVKRASFGEPARRPPKLRQPRKYAKVALTDSSVAGGEGVRADAGLSLGRSFRATWGPNGQLVHIGKICAPGAKFASSPQPTVFVEQVELLADSKAVESQRASRLLSLLLQHTAVELVEGEPAAFTETGIRFHQFADLFDAADRSHEACVWRLGNALFDEIELGLPETTSSDVVQRITEVRRKLALSKWLEDAVAPAVDTDLAKAGDNRPAKVFSLLTGNQIDRAVQSALDGNDMRLATLVSQAGGPEIFRAEVMRQLEDWTKFKSNSLIGYDYRKLYAVLAGVTDIVAGDSTRGPDAAPDVLVAEGLDWKRAFGLQLWYGCPSEESIADVLDQYTASLDSAHPPAKPLPPYLEKPDGGRTWDLPQQPTDVLFNLIKVYADLTVPLDRVLAARDSSPSPTDFRIPFHLYLLLGHALAKRDFEDREDEDESGVGFSATANQITSSYAAQLEEEGQWTWAAFILLHLERAESRRAAIRDLLFRHPDPTQVEIAFLTDKLHVPWEWLHEARAAHLAAAGDAYGEYFELIPAGLVDRAQRTLITKLAPEAVLREDHALLRRLCEALEPTHPTGWEYGGKLFLDYLDLISEVRPLLASVLRAGANPDPTEAHALTALARNVPRVLQLLPALFPDKEDVQQVASLSDMLSDLQALAGVLHPAGFIPRPPVSDLLVDKDRLHLLQAAATESFEHSLQALTA